MGNTNQKLPGGKRAYGHRPEFYSHLDKKIRITRNDIKKKESSYDLNPDFLKIYNQKGQNMSTSISIASVIEYLLVKYNADDIPLSTVSSMFMYDLVRKSHDQLDYNIPVGIRETLDLVQRYGVVEDYNGSIPLKTYLKGYFVYYKCTKDIDVLQTVVSVLKLPIIFGYNVHESFHDSMEWNNDGVMPLPKEKEQIKGVQTGVITGYSTKRNAFIVRNSWGRRWKNQGTFYMPFEYIKSKNCDNFWVINLDFDDQEEVVINNNESMELAEEHWDPKGPKEKKKERKVHFADNVGPSKKTKRKKKKKESSKIKKSKKKTDDSDSEDDDEQITIPLDECMIK